MNFRRSDGINEINIREERENQIIRLLQISEDAEI